MAYYHGKLGGSHLKTLDLNCFLLLMIIPSMSLWVLGSCPDGLKITSLSMKMVGLFGSELGLVLLTLSDLALTLKLWSRAEQGLSASVWY